MRATDWSVGGLRLNDFPDVLPQPGDFLPLNISLPFQGFNVGFEAVGEVVRVVPERREIGMKFVDLGDREARLMQHFVEELVRGSMTDIEDTIQRMDVPLTPVSTKPDVNPKKELPASRRSLRMTLYSGFYIAAGVIVFGYTGLTMYTNFFRLEIDAAVVSAPVETVRADADGRVRWTGFKPGDQVAAGEVVLEVSDNTLEHQLDLAEIDVKEKQSQLLFLKRRQVEELSRMEDFATLEESDLAQKKLDIDAREAAFTAAKAHHERVAALNAKGFATRTQVEEALIKRIAAEKELARMQLDRETRARLFGKNLGMRSLAGDSLVGERASIEAEIKLAESQIEMSREKRDALLSHRSRLSVHAPFAGTLLELPKTDNGSIRRGDVVAVIEQQQARQVIAFLTQDEVLKIGLHDEATIYAPSLGLSVTARVVRIDRTSGFIDEQEGHYNWRAPQDRSAKVILEFVDGRSQRRFSELRTGLPVVVIFDARSTNDIINFIVQAFSSDDGGPPDPAVAIEPAMRPGLDPTIDDFRTLPDDGEVS